MRNKSSHKRNFNVLRLALFSVICLSAYGILFHSLQCVDRLNIEDQKAHRSSSSWIDDCSSFDPCACPSSSSYLMGNGGDLGVMYVVSGSADFAASFPPLIDHLRNTLNIPNAIERQKSQQQPGFEHMKWALVTEPHLCREVLQNVTSFFDIIITIASENDLPTVQQNATLLLPKIINHPSWDRPKSQREKTFYARKVPDDPRLNKTIIGGLSCPYCQDNDKMFWAKSFKVFALSRASPFGKTIFLDTDNIPCYADFGDRIVKKYDLNNREWDVAVSNTRTHTTDTSKLNYWFDEQKAERQKEEWVINYEKPTNLITTRQLGLNVNSKKTRHFLDRYEFEYLYSIIDNVNPKNKFPPSLEQPSFGLAALSMYLNYKEDWKAIHFGQEHFCYSGLCSERPECLLIHRL